MSLQHKELMSAIKSMDDKINKRMDNIETIIAEFKNMKEDIVKLSKKQENQSHELITISNELHIIKQNMLDNEFIITGLPESISESSTLHTVNNVLKYYKIKLTENDVKIMLSDDKQRQQIWMFSNLCTIKQQNSESCFFINKRN